MEDHGSRYKDLIRRIAEGMHADARDALRAQYELITLAHADRWQAIRLDDGVLTKDGRIEQEKVRRNDVAAKEALRAVRDLLAI